MALPGESANAALPSLPDPRQTDRQDSGPRPFDKPQSAAFHALPLAVVEVWPLYPRYFNHEKHAAHTTTRNRPRLPSRSTTCHFLSLWLFRVVEDAFSANRLFRRRIWVRFVPCTEAGIRLGCLALLALGERFRVRWLPLWPCI